MCHSIAKAIEIAAALFGAVGTGFLYKGTFGFEAFPAFLSHDDVRQIGDRNRRRQRMQRIGLGLLLLSFLCGLGHVFVE